MFQGEFANIENSICWMQQILVLNPTEIYLFRVIFSNIIIANDNIGTGHISMNVDDSTG